MQLPVLNFPPYRFRVREGRVWDEVRGAWVVLTPEEWVRRHLVRYLVEECGALPTMLRQEHPVMLGGMRQRADVVVFGRDSRPVLLCECKAPGVAIDASVFAQAVRYNSVLGARYIAATNGLRHFVHELMPDGKYRVLPDFPDLFVEFT